MNAVIQKAARLAVWIPTLAVSTLAVAQAAPSVQPAESAAPVATRTISIEAKKFEFIPAEITLKKGETVQLVLTSEDTHHSLLVKDLGINGDMKKGVVTNVTVTPQEVGDFKGRCGVFCGMGHSKMHFVVHVMNP